MSDHTYGVITTPEDASCRALFDTKGNSTSPLAGNPDIAGVGVVSSFVVSAYMSLAVALFCYPRLLPASLLNDYDRLFMRTRAEGQERWFKALREGILVFSDSQIIQGIGILVAGFANVKTLTVYHWQLVVYMAWMSSNVHLTTLTVLQDYFYRHKMLRNIRLFGMMVLLLLLVVAFVPTSSMNWVSAILQDFNRDKYPENDDPVWRDAWYGLNFAMPVRCFWIPPFNGSGQQAEYMSDQINPDAPFTYVILLVSYAWKVLGLVRQERRQKSRMSKEPGDEASVTSVIPRKPWFKRVVLMWLLRRAKRTARQAPRKDYSTQGFSLSYCLKKLWNIFMLRFTFITYAGFLVLYDFLTSFLASIWVLLLLLVWGTLEIAVVRHKSKTLPDVHDEENEWGFGQVLPILLLAAPVVAAVNHFFRNKKSGQPNEELAQVLHPSSTNLVALKTFKTRGCSLRSQGNSYQRVQNPGQAGQDPSKRQSRVSTTGVHNNDTPSQASDEVDETGQGVATPLQSTSPAPSLHGPTYSQMASDIPADACHPKTSLVTYLLSTGPADPDLDKVSRDFFYKSWTCWSLLLLPNIICALGGAVVFVLEAKAALEKSSTVQAQGGLSSYDQKGWVWVTGVLALAVGATLWFVWVTIAIIAALNPKYVLQLDREYRAYPISHIYPTMQYLTLLAALPALSSLTSALAIRQVDNVWVTLLPSYGCPGADPLAFVSPEYLDGGCHSIDGFNSTQSSLSAPADTTTQTLTFYKDDKCEEVAAVLSNKAAEGVEVADGSCVSAPPGESFEAIRYEK
ncbi:MAG: hypothetical protein Q9162_002826 [Coniocarpon cinnabarinum]